MRAILCGYYGMGNGGDEALLATLLQMLPKHVQPLVLSGNPQETYDRYGVEVCARKSAEVLGAMRRSDAFIWGGGSLMQDATSAMSPFYYGGLMGLAQQVGLKTIAWAQGVGPLNRSLARAVARRTFAGCTAISVRDSGSASLLAKWQLPFVMAPDPVWALESASVPGLWEIAAPRVAVVLRSHPQLTPERLSVLARALADFQEATQTSLLLIPFQPAQDLAIAQTLQAQLPAVSHLLTITDPQQLMGVFHGVEMAIAMRFHGLIMAAAAECRCFAISYDPKVSQLMQDLELPGWDLAQMPTDANQISRDWIELYANGESVSSDRIHALVDRALMHRELLQEALS